MNRSAKWWPSRNTECPPVTPVSGSDSARLERFDAQSTIAKVKTVRKDDAATLAAHKDENQRFVNNAKAQGWLVLTHFARSVKPRVW